MSILSEAETVPDNNFHTFIWRGHVPFNFYLGKIGLLTGLDSPTPTPNLP